MEIMLLEGGFQWICNGLEPFNNEKYSSLKVLST